MVLDMLTAILKLITKMLKLLESKLELIGIHMLDQQMMQFKKPIQSLTL